MKVLNATRPSRPTNVRHMLMTVRGMHSARCAASVGSALGFINGVSDVKVSLHDGRIEFRMDRQKVDLAQLRTAVRAVGCEMLSCVDLDLASRQAAA